MSEVICQDLALFLPSEVMAVHQVENTRLFWRRCVPFADELELDNIEKNRERARCNDSI